MKKLRSKCCQRSMWDDERYCPRCGWECYVEYIPDSLATDKTSAKNPTP